MAYWAFQQLSSCKAMKKGILLLWSWAVLLGRSTSNYRRAQVSSPSHMLFVAQQSIQAGPDMVPFSLLNKLDRWVQTLYPTCCVSIPCIDSQVHIQA